MLLLVCLCSLGIGVVQAAGENSTQVFYAKMKLDRNALEIVKEVLKNFTASHNSLTINNMEISTKCTFENNKADCNCATNYKWDEDVCLAQSECCNSPSCSFMQSSTKNCIPVSTVKVKGNLTLEGDGYKNCLLDHSSPSHIDCKEELLKKMKEVYSTLSGFDSLTILQFRTGSVIVDFEMQIVSKLASDALSDKSDELLRRLNVSGTTTLETTGMVDMEMPSKPVLYNHSTNITCIPKITLTVEPKWTLTRGTSVFNITKGTVSTITSTNNKHSVDLARVDELWAGEYTCLFKQTIGSTIVSHKASAVMDICLLPEIELLTEPEFPRCQKANDIRTVKVFCKIKKTAVKYDVTWNEDSNPGAIVNDTDRVTYTAQQVIACSGAEDKIYASCKFKNKCEQHNEQKREVHIIKAGEIYCEAEGDWKDTKSGHTAHLECKSGAGQRKRACSLGEWEEEVSECVSLKLHSVLGRAVISDIGLGDLNENAADVLASFSNVTKTEDLNSTASIKNSVSVITVLNEKLGAIENQNTVNNFLDASNNLLNDSLKNSWKTDRINESLAEKYLLSVEELIEKSNVFERKLENLEVQVCNSSNCTNDVFNNIVTLDGAGNNEVKTAAFRQLQRLLPLQSNSQFVNSDVVSVTVKGKKQVKVIVDFQLQQPRGRNIMLQCVYWDNNTSSWSSEGCTWLGSASGGKCECTHLSSFAILMSKRPLNVTGLDDMTTVGLSVSIVSLVVSLVIEVIVWQQVVKTNTQHLRHTAHINISLCLLVGNICFLASDPEKISNVWCRVSAMFKHFCYLAMFFWMLSLSTTLLHQAVFLFHKVSKKSYLRFSFLLGYGCPLVIVFVTVLTNGAGAEDQYFSKETCWLVYSGLLKGSIFTFIIPVGIIVFFNAFSMLVVIMKLLEHHKNKEGHDEKERSAAKTVIRSVVLLTPIFGLTWAFGLVVLIVDLTEGTVAEVVNYVFIALNAFQGLYVFLTTCVGDKMTREALLSCFRKKHAASMSDSTVKLDSSWKK